MKLRKPDYFLVIATLALVVTGLVVLFSASSVRGSFVFGSPIFFVQRQLLYGVIPGLALMAFFYFLPFKLLRKLALPMFVGSLFTMLALLVTPFGVTVQGATRWLDIGPISFQPAEFFKFAFVVYLAAFFSKRQISNSSGFFQATVPFWVFLVLAGTLLIAQPATGTFGIIALIGMVMYFFSGAHLKHLIVTCVVLLISLGIVIFGAPYRMERVMTFLNPEYDQQGAAFQINQSLIAIGSGGIDGLGLGQSRQKFHFLPEVIGDSIFAIYAEETGFIGAVALLALFLLILQRGIRMALRTNDMFLRLLAIGFATWIVGQALINIAAMTGLLPLTGIPLPFISYGGSALAAVMAAMGVLFNISRQHFRDAK